MMGSEMQSRYAESCKEVAAQYVESATRFGASDLSVLKTNPEHHNFKITIRHTLEVLSEFQTHQGVLQPSEGDFASADWAWYQEQVADQAQAELNREETLDGLVTTVRSTPYASISTKKLIRTHPRRLFHTYTCNGCHGSGKVTCDSCNGAGQVTCYGCSGAGRVSCSSCAGSGQVSEVRQVRDYSGHYRTETQYRSCSSCSGGRVNCSTCFGSGKNKCRACSGSGNLTCGTCGGHGYLTRVTTTQTYTIPTFSGTYPENTPDYVHAALCKADFAKLELFGQINFDIVKIIREHSVAEFTYDCTIPFCELSVEIKGHPSSWVLFGSPPRIFDSGGALEALLQEDFDRMSALVKGNLYWLPWFHRHARTIVAPFMESEVHQDIIDAHNEGLTPQAIVERVNRSVSQLYIETSLLCLKKTIRIAANWSRIKWITSLTLFSIPFAIGAEAFLERSRQYSMLPTQEQLFLFPVQPAGISWVAGLMTIPFTFLSWFVASWISKGWIKRAGGQRVASWALREDLILSKWTATTLIVSGVIVTGVFFNQWPLWIDRDGNAYGKFALFQAPKIITPIEPAFFAVPKKRVINRRKSNQHQFN